VGLVKLGLRKPAVALAECGFLNKNNRLKLLRLIAIELAKLGMGEQALLLPLPRDTKERSETLGKVMVELLRLGQMKSCLRVIPEIEVYDDWIKDFYQIFTLWGIDKNERGVIGLNELEKTIQLVKAIQSFDIRTNMLGTIAKDLACRKQIDRCIEVSNMIARTITMPDLRLTKPNSDHFLPFGFRDYVLLHAATISWASGYIDDCITLAREMDVLPTRLFSEIAIELTKRDRSGESAYLIRRLDPRIVNINVPFHGFSTLNNWDNEETKILSWKASFLTVIKTY
jgi:hypothetical protein